MKPWQKEFFKISQVYLGNLGMYLSRSKKKKLPTCLYCQIYYNDKWVCNFLLHLVFFLKDPNKLWKISEFLNDLHQIHCAYLVHNDLQIILITNDEALMKNLFKPTLITF